MADVLLIGDRGIKSENSAIAEMLRKEGYRDMVSIGPPVFDADAEFYIGQFQPNHIILRKDQISWRGLRTVRKNYRKTGELYISDYEIFTVYSRHDL